MLMDIEAAGVIIVAACALALTSGVIVASVHSIRKARNGSAQVQGLSLDTLYKMFHECLTHRDIDRCRTEQLLGAASRGAAQLREAISSGNSLQVERVIAMLEEVVEHA